MHYSECDLIDGKFWMRFSTEMCKLFGYTFKVGKNKLSQCCWVTAQVLVRRNNAGRTHLIALLSIYFSPIRNKLQCAIQMSSAEITLGIFVIHGFLQA